MARETVKCVCGADSGYKGPVVGVGDFLKKTGWEFLFFNDGSDQVLCRKCGDEAIALGEKLIEITGSNYCVIPALRGKYK